MHLCVLYPEVRAEPRLGPGVSQWVSAGPFLPGGSPKWNLWPLSVSDVGVASGKGVQ